MQSSAARIHSMNATRRALAEAQWEAREVAGEHEPLALAIGMSAYTDLEALVRMPPEAACGKPRNYPAAAHRFLIAVGGLIAGEAMLLLRTAGEPIQLVYVIAAAVGWAVIGLPVILPMPPAWIVRMPWLVTVTLGVCLGPLALLSLVVFAGNVKLSSPSLMHDPNGYWFTASLVSATAVLTYAAGIRHLWNKRKASQQNDPDG